MSRTFNFMPCLFVIAMAASVMSLPTLSRADSDELKLKRSFGLRGDGESHVQMRSMLAPVKRRASSVSFSSIPVTPVLTVVSKDEVGHVCRLGPRISDALLSAWYEKPMTLAYIFDPDRSQEKIYRISKTQVQKSEDQRLIAAINAALKSELVSDILIIKGARQMGGGGISKLPFASLLGCAELEGAPEASEEEKPKSH